MTQAKERPILFSAPMMRAILEGRKTVTRRVCKPQPSANAHTKSADGSPMTSWWETGKDIVRCPYGQPGERLWVREAWQADAQVNAIAPRELSHGEPIQYPADGSSRQTGCSMITPGKTRPSIHMPRWVSRILLEVTAVRVERLNDIAENQARAEGITDGGCNNCGNNEPCGCECPAPSAVDSFVHLWDSINGAGAWDVNPWVWVVEFKRVTQ
ncbi:hypothetical protein QIT82_gp17 [Pseudomonas phage psageK9]|uniref:Morphogenetic protein n=2 Tax=Readingvirus TaxID=3152626 RepID=A0A059VF56_9CAUD|nr:hypothetical protein [Pseudomonas syringae]YP_009043570.1 hypothetical protein HH36_gp20 [Pseudomonas phage phiPSA1]YP_010773223.1 hypothetical protein QIT82_gp17 [Pseudomonas phage psageK9]QXV71597.1 hypothetical protein psageB2_020c [Pseudomonas phage psageB2]AHZ95049.1 hypothetical protein [Pseudomonas phage phiPSA1]MDG6423776.1 hypothetical protein [Pseudomonas syringae pv. actinidiae]MDG6439157.1 hypothetical protein [Pseudomonas syringae pv. actinidiae]UAW53887.1 hypothetical protei